MYAKYRKAIVNPFDKGALGAKIPDGKATVSNTMRVQTVRQLTLSTNANLESYLVLHAGLFTNAWGKNMLCSSAPLNAGNAITYENSIDMYYTGSGDSTSNILVQSKENCNKWRVVSQGTVMTLVNNADENDGWFEAIRVDPTWSREDDYDKLTVAAVPTNGNPGLTTQTAASRAAPGLLGAAPLDETFGDVEIPFIQTSAEWANHPTYITGKIRDIHMYSFNLNPTQTDHDFIDIPNASAYAYAENSRAQAAVIESGFDKSWDCIAIRFHGRTGVSDIPSSKLVVHTVSNQEMLFDENSIAGMSATACPGARKSGMAGQVIAPAKSYNWASGVGRRAAYKRRTYKRRKAPVKKRKTTTRKRRVVRRKKS